MGQRVQAWKALDVGLNLYTYAIDRHPFRRKVVGSIK